VTVNGLVIGAIGSVQTLGIALLFPGVLTLLRAARFRADLRSARHAPLRPEQLRQAKADVPDLDVFHRARSLFVIQAHEEPDRARSVERLARYLGSALTIAGVLLLGLG
jgi:hypothetical protein